MYRLTDDAKDEVALEVYKINCESARKALAQQIIERLKYNREKNNKGGKLC